MPRAAYKARFLALQAAATTLCAAAFWKADRPVDGGEKAPWKALREAAEIANDPTTLPADYKASPHYKPGPMLADDLNDPMRETNL